ncbi:MAG TPA: hypothetical protein VH092_15745, partial [Urbifossiella sp.]|nr:hypothetical protein [Urbifossiella sp.]
MRSPRSWDDQGIARGSDAAWPSTRGPSFRSEHVGTYPIATRRARSSSGVGRWSGGRVGVAEVGGKWVHFGVASSDIRKFPRQEVVMSEPLTPELEARAQELA